MNLHLLTPGQTPSFSESQVELTRLLERCRRDLLFTEELLSEIEKPDSSEVNLARTGGRPVSEDLTAEQRQKSVSQGADAIRRLTANIDALAASSSDGDVQGLLEDLHDKMVRCLKLLPSQHRK